MFTLANTLCVLNTITHRIQHHLFTENEQYTTK